MKKNQSTNLGDLNNALNPPGEGAGTTEKGGRSFKPDTGKFDSLVVNQSLTGFFMGAKHQTITDIRTRLPKDIFILKLREDSEESRILKIPAASMMMQAWDDVVDEYGNGDQDEAIRKLRGRKLTINRGEDTKTRGGTQLGQYEIIVWD